MKRDNLSISIVYLFVFATFALLYILGCEGCSSIKKPKTSAYIIKL